MQNNLGKKKASEILFGICFELLERPWTSGSRMCLIKESQPIWITTFKPCIWSANACFGTRRIFEYVFVHVVPNVFSVMFMEKVISIEKMEDTSLLPNPIIVSIRSKTAFQFIELKDRDTLVENLLQRLKEVNSSNLLHCNNLQNNNQVMNFYFIINSICLSIIPLSCLLWEAPKLILS